MGGFRHLVVFNDAVLCARVVRAPTTDPSEPPVPAGSPIVPLLNRPGSGANRITLELDWFEPLDKVEQP